MTANTPEDPSIAISNRRNTGFKLLLSLACVIIVIGGLKAASGFLTPILLGAFLAILSLPITTWFKNHRVPHPLAVVMTVAIDLLILFALILATANIMPNFQKSAAKYDQRLRMTVLEKVDQIETWMNTNIGPIQEWFNEAVGDDEPGATENEETEDVPAETPAVSNDTIIPQDEEVPPAPVRPVAAPVEFDLRSTVENLLTFNRLVSVVNWVNQTDVIPKITSFFTKTFLAFILMIFILAEANRFASTIGEIVEARGPNLRKFRNASRDVQRYLGIKTVASIVTGFLAWLVCALFGVEFAVLWGLLAFFLNYVPTIGSLVAAIPPVLVALLQLGFWPSFGLAIFYLLINVTIGNFIEPMLLGKRFGISTVVVILSVLFWGWVWGPVGMFLSVPLTMIIKIMLENSDDFRWISIMMGKNTKENIDAILSDEREPHSPSLPPGTEEPV